MSTHDLKTHPAHFAAVWSGEKRAELRKDDRAFAVGDVLWLREWNPDKASGDLLAMMPVPEKEWDAAIAQTALAAYTGRAIRARVTHIVSGGPWLAEGYVMLSIDVEDCHAPR